MSRVDRRKRFEIAEATPVEQRPQIWVDGRQQPKFKIGPYVAVSIAIAKRDLLPDMLETETRLRAFADRVREGEIRPNLAWAGRFARAFPDHDRVSGWIFTAADVYGSARAKIEGKSAFATDHEEELAYPDLIRRPAKKPRPVRPRRANDPAPADPLATGPEAEASLPPEPSAFPAASHATPDAPLFPEPDFLAAAFVESPADAGPENRLLGQAVHATDKDESKIPGQQGFLAGYFDTTDDVAAGLFEGMDVSAIRAANPPQTVEQAAPAVPELTPAYLEIDPFGIASAEVETWEHWPSAFAANREEPTAYAPGDDPISLSPDVPTGPTFPRPEGPMIVNALDLAFAAGLAFDGAALVDPAAPIAISYAASEVAEVVVSPVTALHLPMDDVAEAMPAQAALACEDGLADQDEIAVFAEPEVKEAPAPDSAATSAEAAIRGLFAELMSNEAEAEGEVEPAPLTADPEPEPAIDPDLGAIRLAMGSLEIAEPEVQVAAEVAVETAPAAAASPVGPKPAQILRIDPNNLDDEELAREKTALSKMLSGFEELNDPFADAADGPWGSPLERVQAKASYPVPAKRPGAVTRVGSALVRGSGRAVQATGRGLGKAGVATGRGVLVLLRGTAATLGPATRPLRSLAGRASFAASAWALAGLMLAFATPGGAIKAMIYYLDGGDLTDWS